MKIQKEVVTKITRYVEIQDIRFNIDSTERVKVVKSTIPDDMFTSHQSRQHWIEKQYTKIKKYIKYMKANTGKQK